MENLNLTSTAEEMDQAYDESLEKILELIEEKKYFQCRDELLKHDEVEISEMLDDVRREYDLQKVVILFRTLPKDVSVEVFSYLDVDYQVDVINMITDPEIEFIIDELDFDDMIDVLEELPANVVDKILSKTTKAERKKINQFLKYKDDTAGSLMTPDYINLTKSWTVREALDHIKEVGLDSETIYSCYVIDRGRKLIGVVSLRALVICDDNLLVSDIMHDDPLCVNVDEDQEEVMDLFNRYGYLAIPVVDNEGRLVGIVTVDDILDVIEEETSEDIERMGGVISNDDKSYLDMSVWSHVKARFPWLLLLMCSYFVTGGIISSFENALSDMICLVTYMPLLMGTAGNSGTQSSTLVIRGMATGDIELDDFIKVAWKEIRVSVTVGLCLSVINTARIVFITHEPFLVAVTVCLSMIIAIMIAKLIGAMLPMIAKKIGIDPALMAGPLMASITDMLALGTYFLMAGIFLHI
ncbi:MAG: magnesium transporter [Clostridiales bacterium]|nr:magnesium transporter [Candidatus Crickella equi]